MISFLFDFAWISNFSETPWCALHRGVNYSKFLRSQEHNVSKKLCSMHYFTETIFAVSITPRRQPLRCASLRGVNHHSVHHSTDITPQSKNTNLGLTLVAFKGRRWVNCTYTVNTKFYRSEAFFCK